MAEYIKREDAVCAIRGFSKTAVGIATETLVWAENVILDTVPSADVAEVRHGKWTLTGWDRGIKVEECSLCSKRAYGATPFCPHCGARMDGGT